mgnify:FL=1
MAPLKQSSDQAEHLPNAIIHSMEGSYTEGNRMKSGGHGQDAIDYMDQEWNQVQYRQDLSKWCQDRQCPKPQK